MASDQDLGSNSDETKLKQRLSQLLEFETMHRAAIDWREKNINASSIKDLANQAGALPDLQKLMGKHIDGVLASPAHKNSRVTLDAIINQLDRTGLETLLSEKENSLKNIFKSDPLLPIDAVNIHERKQLKEIEKLMFEHRFYNAAYMQSHENYLATQENKTFNPADQARHMAKFQEHKILLGDAITKLEMEIKKIANPALINSAGTLMQEAPSPPEPNHLGEFPAAPESNKNETYPEEEITPPARSPYFQRKGPGLIPGYLKDGKDMLYRKKQIHSERVAVLDTNENAPAAFTPALKTALESWNKPDNFASEHNSLAGKIKPTSEREV